MARNPIPATLDRLFSLADDMIDGLTVIGDSTGIVQNTAAVLTTALVTARTSEVDYQNARREKTAATASQTIADSNAKAFIANAKRVLIPHLGATWSTTWAPVGFVDGSIETPDALDKRYNLLDTLRSYLAANPTQENAPLGITAAAATALHTALKTARTALKTALATLGIARDTRAKETATLRTRMRGLINELDVLLPDEDPRWYQFGLNAPGDPETPEAPEAPTLTPGIAGSGLLFLDWPDTRRTDRYRVWQKLPGEPTFTPVATITESDATLDSLPTGVLLEFQITAISEAGESVPSPVSAITLIS